MYIGKHIFLALSLIQHLDIYFCIYVVGVRGIGICPIDNYMSTIIMAKHI